MTTTIFISALIFFILLAFLVYYSKAYSFIKFLILPVFLSIILMANAMYNNAKGAAIEGLPQEEFIYVYHIAVDQGESIQLWVITKDQGSRLYMFPYNRDLMEQLEQARARSASTGGEYGKLTKIQGSNAIEYESVSPENYEEGFIK